MTDSTPQFSVFPLCINHSYKEIRTLFQEAERLGFVAAFHQDNVLGHTPTPRDSSLFDVWTLLPALAEATSKIRLGTMVTPAPRRHPAVLAKAASALDVISDGRLIVGMGTGDDPIQYSQWGQEFPASPRERIALLREHLTVQRLMWTERQANFAGKYFNLENAMNEPKPIQKPHPPIWVGINRGTKVMPKVAAEYCDGVAVMWGSDEIAERIVERVEQECVLRDRDMDGMTMARTALCVFTDGSLSFGEAVAQTNEIAGFPFNQPLETGGIHADQWADVAEEVIVGTPAEVAEELKHRTVDLGFDHIIAHFFNVGLDLDEGDLHGWAGNFLGAMRLFASEVIPRFVHKGSESARQPVSE